jgi:large subunit ribosomal protein L2
MGRRILVQRRGKGTQNFRSPKHKKRGAVKYISLPKDVVKEGTLIDFIHEGGRGTPIGLIDYGNGQKVNWLPPEGVFIGDKFSIGTQTELAIGNTMALKNIPEGTLVYNIEIQPVDGGKMVRTAGGTATVVTRSEKGVVVLLPSGKRKTFNQMSRATVGVVAGGGISTKPFMKAGARRYYERTKPKTWPVVNGNVMNANSHPFGGGSKHRAGMSTTTSRNAPPGRKVGMIAARQSGRK